MTGTLLNSSLGFDSTKLVGGAICCVHVKRNKKIERTASKREKRWGFVRFLEGSKEGSIIHTIKANQIPRSGTASSVWRNELEVGHWNCRRYRVEYWAISQVFVLFPTVCHRSKYISIRFKRLNLMQPVVAVARDALARQKARKSRHRSYLSNQRYATVNAPT